MPDVISLGNRTVAVLPAPRLNRIRSREALFALKHSDVLVVKDLRRHFRWWPALVIDDPDERPQRRSWKAGRKKIRGLAGPT